MAQPPKVGDPRIETRSRNSSSDLSQKFYFVARARSAAAALGAAQRTGARGVGAVRNRGLQRRPDRGAARRADEHHLGPYPTRAHQDEQGTRQAGIDRELAGALIAEGAEPRA